MKNKIKKHVVMILTIMMVIGMLSGCGKTNQTETANPQGNTSDIEDKSETNQEATDRNVLVAYFSYSGNTKEVAEQISELTGGTLAEIQRKEAYPTNNDEFTEMAENEIKNGDRPEITVSVDNVEKYDTVFVGYPIWYDEAPAMISTFLASYNFEGKRLIPFCTSSSDTIDASLHIFSEISPNATIENGFTANNDSDIAPWIETLGLNKVEDSQSTSGKILTAYFTVPETDGVDAVASASRVVDGNDVVGNTQYVAGIIQETVGGDLFAIETKQKYPGSHDELLEFAYEEKGENARPELSTKIDNLDQYDTIFIGFPNWNADLPMPLYTFLEKYDFSGKTIIPFVTHGGSGFSRTIDTIRELQPDANVIEDGLSISRNDVAKAESEVIEWAQSMLNQ